MEVHVHGKSNIEMAIRAFRKRSQKAGTVKEARRRKHYNKPSAAKKLKEEDNIARRSRARKGEYSF